MNRKPLTKKQKGFVIITGGLMLMFIIPIVGLAVDASFLFAVKARLQSAADASALAAARSLNVGLTVPAQEANAKARAQAFFDANYPQGLFGTTSRTFNADVAETAFRTRTVTITAAVDSPLFFMRILVNSPTTVVSAMGKASRRDVNVIMVLDRSGSMTGNGGCPAMRNAAKGFIDLFANERDRLAMVTYGISYAISYAPNKNFKTSAPTMSAVIDTISCAGGTGAAQGLAVGYQQILAINEPGALNVIIFFTDGIPNTVTADFPVNTLDTTRVADGATISGTITNNRTSRCFHWTPPAGSGTGNRWFRNNPTTGVWEPNPAWNPNTEVFRGAIYSQEGLAGTGNTLLGIVPYVSTGFTDPSGVIARPAEPVADPDPMAPHPAPTPIPYTAGTRTTDCWFQGGFGHNGGAPGIGTATSYVQYDIAFYPEKDIYGNLMRSPDNFVSVQSFPMGYVVPAYRGRIDVRDKTNMMNASIAAVDNAGKRIRDGVENADIKTVVYTIGLAEAQVNQHTLLRRIANDQASPIFDSSKLEGLYVYAPTAAELNTAFVRIAAEILRIAQ